MFLFLYGTITGNIQCVADILSFGMFSFFMALIVSISKYIKINALRLQLCNTLVL